MVISPFTPVGIDSQQTTNTSIVRFMESLWGLKPLNTFTAQQNDFTSAFRFDQKPAAAPTLPLVPTDTIGFYDSTTTPGVGRSFTVSLQANDTDLALDSSVSGPVSLTVIPPAGVSVPSSFPAGVTMTGGTVSFAASFSTAGYYRIEATGPGNSQGWTTVDVGVNPNTLP